MIKLVENELYQEIGIFLDGTHIGEMEIDLKGKMLSRLFVYEPYQNMGYGQEIVRLAKEKYGCDCLWVRADNERAIHVYEKLGFVKKKPTMYLMTSPTIIPEDDSKELCKFEAAAESEQYCERYEPTYDSGTGAL